MEKAIKPFAYLAIAGSTGPGALQSTSTPPTSSRSKKDVSSEETHLLDKKAKKKKDKEDKDAVTYQERGFFGRKGPVTEDALEEVEEGEWTEEGETKKEEDTSWFDETLKKTNTRWRPWQWLS